MPIHLFWSKYVWSQQQSLFSIKYRFLFSGRAAHQGQCVIYIYIYADMCSEHNICSDNIYLAQVVFVNHSLFLILVPGYTFLKSASR